MGGLATWRRIIGSQLPVYKLQTMCVSSFLVTVANNLSEEGFRFTMAHSFRSLRLGLSGSIAIGLVRQNITEAGGVEQSVVAHDDQEGVRWTHQWHTCDDIVSLTKSYPQQTVQYKVISCIICWVS